jgi:hypothetical protein
MRTTKKSSRRRRRRRRTRHGIDSEVEDCFILDRQDIDHQGLAKNIDAEYFVEEEKLGLSFWDVLERERNRDPKDISEKSRTMSAWARAKRRMTYARGDVESKYVLMADRTYGDPSLLDQDHLRDPPSLDDLNQEPAGFKERYWSTTVFRVGVVATAYLAYPAFLHLVHVFQTIEPEDFDIVVGQIAPNVGVLYATLLALTLQVLYSRFTRIQENVATEAMLLSQVTRNLLSLFANEKEWAVESCQVVANQVRIMLSRTRGVELLSIMKADTYSNLLAIVDDYHYLHGCDADYSSQEESLTSMLRSEIGQLMETRALRLSDEASSLPPTHFLLITSLSFVSVVAYVTASLKVVDDLMHPPQEASLLFAGLVALYFLFFNFCRDLNGPFGGVYQISRSNAISHLMQTKWLIVNQLGEDVSFTVNYGKAQPKIIEEEKSFVNKIGSFFSGNAEDIATVEVDAMQTLVNELESAVEIIGEEGDLCDAVETPTTSLDCTEDGREARLLKLQDELSRVKDLNQQLAHADSKSTVGQDPAAKLHQMEQELGRLKQLNQQINNSALASTGHINADACTLATVANGNLSVAKAALEQASLEAKLAEKALAEASTAASQQSSMVESKVKSLTDKGTGAVFDRKLDEDLYLVGVGVRKKGIINVYAVGMYSSPSVIEAISPLLPGKEAHMALRDMARASATSFVMEMNFKADAQTIAGAIAESVKPRYGGPAADVNVLEALIFEGIENKGGQATKGTVFCFDCSKEGVAVSVDGRLQGIAKLEGMGSAFVDVYMDDEAASPTLVASCLDTWCNSGIHQERENAKQHVVALTKQADEARANQYRARKAVDGLKAKQREEMLRTEIESTKQATSSQAKPSDQLEQAEKAFRQEQIKMAEEEERVRAQKAVEQASEEARQKSAVMEAKVMPLKEKATGVSFDPKLDDGMFLVGVGVRKKAIINVYAVAMYSSSLALEALSQFPRGKQKQEAQAALQNTARTFSNLSPTTSFVLDMVFKADAKTIAGAIADGIKPRYTGPAADVKELESLIIDGVKSKGGQATKGTLFRFDCTTEGVRVSVDGHVQGTATYEGMGSAFVDVFTDDKAVSSQLIESSLNTWCGSTL